MAIVIHREKQFQKCLQKLHRAGGRAAGAAERISAIIERVSSNEHRQTDHVSRLTSNGEARIEKCRKFDLAGGYRLIYVTRGESYYFLFAGTHDECARWLKNHTDFEPEPAAEMTEVLLSSSATITQPDQLESFNEADSVDDYDSIILKDVDDQLLRRIFRGLCGEERR